MGVEVVKSEGFEVAAAPSFEAVTGHGKENGHKVSIRFGSHDENVKEGEEDNDKNVFSSNAPKDVTEEWPAAKQIHTFYFVRFRTYDDPKIKAKLDQTDRELHKLNRARSEIVEELKAKRAERAELFAQLTPLKSERDGFNMIFDEKKKEMEPLQQALGKLRNTDGGSRGFALCSSKEELNDLIQSLHYRIQHESISLNEEKQILKEIKQLEGTREKVIANAAMRAKIKESLGQKEDIQGQVKLMGSDLDGVRKERQAVSAKINALSERVKATKEEIQSLENELKSVTEKRDKTFANLQELRKQRDETNANFYQSRTVLNKARELAAYKNVKDLEALSHAEVEKFMSLWSCKKTFRADYEKRILSSLDARQLSRDGRIRNPDEKPLVAPEAPLPSETETVSKTRVKQPKEDSILPPKQDNSHTEKTQNEVTNKAKDANKVKNAKSSSEHKDTVDEDVLPGLGKLQKDTKPAEKEVDEAKLKEIKRQEEVAKAKQAMERKKKLAEKAAAKAAVRAQKEAEKKLKEREKKAKKKAAGNSTSEPETATEAVVEASELEKTEAEAPAAIVEKPEKEKVSKEKPVRYRTRAKGPETLPRAILKRKRSTSYWLWAAPAAVIVLILVAIVYYYSL